MKYLSLAAAILGMAGMFSAPVLAQEPQQQSTKDLKTLDKQIAELESKLASLHQDLQDLRRQRHELSPITVIPVKFIDAVQAAEILEKLTSDTPGVLVEALPKLKGVAVRADQQLTREILEFLRELDEAANSRHGPFRMLPVRLDDLTVVLHIVGWLKRNEQEARNTQNNGPCPEQ